MKNLYAAVSSGVLLSVSLAAQRVEIHIEPPLESPFHHSITAEISKEGGLFNVTELSGWCGGASEKTTHILGAVSWQYDDVLKESRLMSFGFFEDMTGVGRVLSACLRRSSYYYRWNRDRFVYTRQDNSTLSSAIFPTDITSVADLKNRQIRLVTGAVQNGSGFFLAKDGESTWASAWNSDNPVVGRFFCDDEKKSIRTAYYLVMSPSNELCAFTRVVGEPYQHIAFKETHTLESKREFSIYDTADGRRTIETGIIPKENVQQEPSLIDEVLVRRNTAGDWVKHSLKMTVIKETGQYRYGVHKVPYERTEKTAIIFPAEVVLSEDPLFFKDYYMPGLYSSTVIEWDQIPSEGLALPDSVCQYFGRMIINASIPLINENAVF